jgi:hypothetical protein
MDELSAIFCFSQLCVQPRKTVRKETFEVVNFFLSLLFEVTIIAKERNLEFHQHVIYIFIYLSIRSQKFRETYMVKTSSVFRDFKTSFFFHLQIVDFH